MINQLQENKLKDFKEQVKSFLQKQKNGVEDIHKLRVKSRELFSLLDNGEPFYDELKGVLKKIIKKTNQVRDLDVFLEEYLTQLPKKYTTKLDIQNIDYDIQKERDKDIKILHKYLEHLDAEDALEFDYKKSEFRLEDKKQLHKYRIYIKKSLYNEKNNHVRDEEKIELLTKIKDALGTINDNYNALERLSSLGVDGKLFKKIQKDTDEKNLRLFKDFIYFNSFV